MIAYKDGPRVRLVSRSGVDHTARFPGIAAAVAGLLAPQLILDGEVCVFDDQLISQFICSGGAALTRQPSRPRPFTWCLTVSTSVAGICVRCRWTSAARCWRTRSWGGI
jgi:hypothetical protein